MYAHVRFHVYYQTKARMTCPVQDFTMVEDAPVLHDAEVACLPDSVLVPCDAINVSPCMRGIAEGHIAQRLNIPKRREKQPRDEITAQGRTDAGIMNTRTRSGSVAAPESAR